MPLIAALPLIYFASVTPGMRTDIALPFFGTIHFATVYFYVIIPLLVMIVTNTVNQLGGLNGLETVCPAIIMVGLMFLSGSHAILLVGPLIIWLVLAYFNLKGKIFVGNTGSFGIGMTLAAFAIISDLKVSLVISLVPYILNSALVLLTYLFFKKKAQVAFDGHKLSADHRRSLITLVTYRRQFSERQVVAIIALAVAASTVIGCVVQLI